MRRQIINISELGFNAMTWQNDDIETIVQHSFAEMAEGLTLSANFEEFVYRNPELLASGTDTTVLLDLPLTVELDKASASSYEILLNEAWGIDTANYEWHISNLEDMPVGFATLIERQLARFIDRSFHPLTMVPVLYPFMLKWKNQALNAIADAAALDVHVDCFNGAYYCGFFRNDRMLMAPVYRNVENPVDLLYFIKETLKQLRTDGEEPIRLFIDKYNGNLEWLTENLRSVCTVINTVFSSKSSFKTFIYDSKTVVLPIKEAVLYV